LSKYTLTDFVARFVPEKAGEQNALRVCIPRLLLGDRDNSHGQDYALKVEQEHEIDQQDRSHDPPKGIRKKRAGTIKQQKSPGLTTESKRKNKRLIL